MIVSGSLLNVTRLPARCAAEASCVLSCGVVVPAEGAQRAELAPIFAPPHQAVHGADGVLRPEHGSTPRMNNNNNTLLLRTPRLAVCSLRKGVTARAAKVAQLMANRAEGPHWPKARRRRPLENFAVPAPSALVPAPSALVPAPSALVPAPSAQNQ